MGNSARGRLTFLVICGPVSEPDVEPSKMTQLVSIFLVWPLVLAVTREKLRM